MKLFLLTQNQNNGYDTYDAYIVVAETINEAVKILPSDLYTWESAHGVWASSPEHVTATYIGEAAHGYKGGEVILASFNAG